MKLEIATKNVVRESMVREYIHRKVQFALDRFEDHVREVVVRLEDETKDSPMFRGLCSIEVRLEPRGQVHVSARGESSYDCVLNAIRKMEQAVKHDIDRHRRGARIRHEGAKRDFVESLVPGELLPEG